VHNAWASAQGLTTISKIIHYSMGRLAGVGDAKLWIRLARVAPLLGILMGVRLIPGRRQSKIVAFGGILALVHRPPWPFTPVGQAPPLLTDETAPESGVKGRLISERDEPMPT
jgi:hypothetical protein